MKKVLIGILILIPIIILIVVALVANMLQLQAWVAVESLTVTDRLSGKDASFLQPAIDVDENAIYDLNDYVRVLVSPDKANQTVDWAMSNVQCSDSEYQQKYEAYLQNPVGTPVYPAAVLIDGSGFGHEETTNTSGKFRLYAYCSFEITVSAETFNKTFTVNIVGSTVARVTLSDTSGNDSASMTVGESMRLSTAFVPLDSKVEELKFQSSMPDTVSVDENGVITALGVGSATITAQASKYDEDGEGKEKEFVTSNSFVVTVGAGAGRYGDKVTLEVTDGGKYSFEQLGISAADIDEAASENCTVLADGVVINGEGATLSLKNGKALTVDICAQDAIKINNADIFANREGGFVLGVNERGLQLSVSYAATAKEGQPKVSWSSNNTQVATVDDEGTVMGISNGVATITARAATRAGEQVAAVEINVHNKVSLLRLKTSDASLRTGLAQETIYASYKYKHLTAEEGVDKFEKLPNTVFIHLQGEPEDEEEQANFYKDFLFEVVEGGEYAHFDQDAPNMFVIDGSALEGKGIVSVKVMAHAKYPRFETNSEHTTAYVTLKVVYGVDVTTFEQAMRAGQDQRKYAFGDKEKLDGTILDSFDVNNNKFRVIETERPAGNFAITLANDIAAPEDLIINWDDPNRCIVLYGDLYGNGHMISTLPQNLVDWASYDVRVACSNVTVSNVTIRHENFQPDKLDAHTFENSYCLIVCSENSDMERVTNVRLEYSIFENSHSGVEIDNMDGVIDGCLFRNIGGIGIYDYARTRSPEGANGDEFNFCFSRMTINNCVFSSVIAVSISASHESFALDGATGRFSSSDNLVKGQEESYKWVEDNLVPRGYVTSIKQTGFLDIYNWQNATDANLIDTGDETYNSMIRAMITPMFSHPAFLPGVYSLVEDGVRKDYFHLGLMTSGINLGGGVANERTFTQYSFEDDRFFRIYSRELSDDYPGITQSIKGVLSILKNFEVTLYCYKKESSLSPMSTYTVNSRFIEHLHEGK